MLTNAATRGIDSTEPQIKSTKSASVPANEIVFTTPPIMTTVKLKLNNGNEILSNLYFLIYTA